MRFIEIITLHYCTMKMSLPTPTRASIPRFITYIFWCIRSCDSVTDAALPLNSMYTLFLITPCPLDSCRGLLPASKGSHCGAEPRHKVSEEERDGWEAPADDTAGDLRHGPQCHRCKIPGDILGVAEVDVVFQSEDTGETCAAMFLATVRRGGRRRTPTRYQSQIPLRDQVSSTW
jgi:hypothetical protein